MHRSNLPGVDSCTAAVMTGRASVIHIQAGRGRGRKVFKYIYYKTLFLDTTLRATSATVVSSTRSGNTCVIYQNDLDRVAPWSTAKAAISEISAATHFLFTVTLAQQLHDSQLWIRSPVIQRSHTFGARLDTGAVA